MIDFNDRTWINYIDEQVWKNLPESSLKSRNNSQIVFRCPICGDSKKNKLKKRGYFYRNTGTYSCFNCDIHLSGYDLLKAITSKDVFDRIINDYKVLNFNNIIRGKNNTKKSNALTPKSFEIRSPNPSYKYLLELGWKTEPLTNEATNYLDGRMIPNDKRDMLKSIKDTNGREFILIQYIYDDSCIYHQIANFNKYDIAGQGAIKYIFPKEENINGQEKPVFNINNVDVSFPYIVCLEGIFDSLFVKNGVALGGKNLTDFQYNMLKECYPRHKIVLAFDNDRAGIQSSLKHADKYDVSFLNTFDLLSVCGVKDINDFVKRSGRLDVFSNPKVIKSLVMSPFMVKMKLKLNG